MEELKNIKVALLGSGTVGTGVYKLIERQREELPHKVGAGLTVSKVLVRDKNKKRDGIDPSRDGFWLGLQPYFNSNSFAIVL